MGRSSRSHRPPAATVLGRVFAFKEVLQGSFSPRFSRFPPSDFPKWRIGNACAPSAWTPTCDGATRLSRLHKKNHFNILNLTRQFMDTRKRNEIEARLRQLMENSDLNPNQDTPKEEAPAPSRACHVIRRRKGQRDKRIFISK
jgi:hypothetical protein